MKICCNDQNIVPELIQVVKLFFGENFEDARLDLSVNYEVKNCTISTTIIYGKTGKKSRCAIFEDTLTTTQLSNQNKYIKRYIKLHVYKVLSKYTGKKLPWGSLTGIRPTKLLYELRDIHNKDLNKATYDLKKIFYVTKQKAKIAQEIIQNQNIVKDDRVVDFYINIPFCPTRCRYCSFVSGGMKECGHMLEPYLDTLIYDVEKSLEFLKENGYEIKTIYIGGGTPTTLSPAQLDRLLSSINISVKEFTVESGRPDTITKEKLDVLKSHNVSRICINPQTFCDDTLRKIGRDHSTTDTLNAYSLAKSYDFIINMDLIAGLEDESFGTFKNSLNTAISLNPDNITVHTLSVKKASRLIEEKHQLQSAKLVEKMVDYSYKTLSRHGYKPYYLYRQKNMIGNLENIGYFKGDTKCIFNIDSMEECASIFACGANAISKRYWSKSDRIERWANVKNLNEYNTRIDEMLEKKFALFDTKIIN